MGVPPRDSYLVSWCDFRYSLCPLFDLFIFCSPYVSQKYIERRITELILAWIALERPKRGFCRQPSRNFYALRSLVLVSLASFKMAAAKLGRLAVKNTAFLLCDIQEKFRPSIIYFPEIIKVAQRMVRSFWLFRLIKGCTKEIFRNYSVVLLSTLLRFLHIFSDMSKKLCEGKRYRESQDSLKGF